MVPEFESMAFSINNIVDVSTPFRTDYGWHIIMLLEKMPIAEFVDIKTDLKRMIEKDSRGELSQKALYEKLRNTYKVVNKPSVYAAFRKGCKGRIEQASFV